MPEINTQETPPAQDAPALVEQVRVDTVASQGSSLRERLAAALAHPRAPLVAGAVVALALGAGALGVRGPATLPFQRPDIVLFDPVRFTNAQRAAASILAVSPSADLSLTLTQVAKRAEDVIREEAHGAVVLVKQTVVAPVGIPDITDAVLDRFGLPKNVPTVTVRPGDSEAIENVAPSDNAFSSGQLREDYRLELEGRRSRLAADQDKKDNQAKVLP